MSPEDVSRVQSSFEAVKPVAAQAAALFYERLFAIAPRTHPLFTSDMTGQGSKLMEALSFVVAGLDRIETILPIASSLAKSHVPFGVKPEHYPPVGAALLWMLEKQFGEAWTPELSASWARVYGVLAEFMISEAYGASVAEAVR